MGLLSREAFGATFTPPMIRLPDDAEPALDFWPYFDAIPQGDFAGHDCQAGLVRHVWQTPDGRFVHVLVSSLASEDVFMVIVLDLAENAVHGHHLLDLEQAYGLPSAE